MGRPRGKKPDLARRPTVFDALRATLFGSGALEWISVRRKRGLQISLFGGGVLIGVLTSAIAVRLPDGALDPTAKVLGVVTLVLIVAIYMIHDVVMGLELLEKRQVEADLSLARRIQLRMLPSELPALEGFRFAVHHEAARSVGGDAYDVLVLDDDHVFFLIADVSGKGTAAAMLMSGILARTRALARTGMPLGELATRLSTALDEETETIHFATMVAGVLELSSGVLRYVNAGNERPVILRPNGSRVVLETSGIPVGMLPGVTYTTGQAFVGPGDRLILTTDGVHDADEEGSTLLSSEELESLIASEDDPVRSLERVAAEVDRRTAKHRFDDVTVLLIRRDAQASSDASG